VLLDEGQLEDLVHGVRGAEVLAAQEQHDSGVLIECAGRSQVGKFGNFGPSGFYLTGQLGEISPSIVMFAWCAEDRVSSICRYHSLKS
jgi:hypothetical protein